MGIWAKAAAPAFREALVFFIAEPEPGSTELGGAALWPVLSALRDQLRVARPVDVVEMDPRSALRLLVRERRPTNGLRRPCD